MQGARAMATIKGKGSNTPEDTGTQQALGRKATQFKPGESGNPKGRPKGARNRLGTKFLEALEADFNKHGAQAIEQVRQKKPEGAISSATCDASPIIRTFPAICAISIRYLVSPTPSICGTSRGTTTRVIAR
jgi:hypothetical protein